MTKCTDIILLEHLDSETDVLKVIIDNEVESIMFYNYGESLQYVGQDVIVTYRKDLYKAQVCQCINTITIPVKINTLDRDTSIKLFVDQEDNFSNLSFVDILEGETKLNAIVYCVSHTYESSANATWAKLRVRDRSMRLATVRLFSYEYGKHDFSGSYIRSDLTRNQYGFSTKIVTPMDGECPPNPETTIAKAFILEAFADYYDILTFITKTRILELMEDYIDIERGYMLVRLAMEIAMAKELVNISNAVSSSLIRKSLLLGKAFILNQTSEYSVTFRNMVTASQHPIEDKKEIMLMLDNAPSTLIPEATILNDIIHTVDNLIRIKKEV